MTNELFKHIIYYPIFDVDDESKITAILEVAYKKRASEEIMTDDIQNYIDQLRSSLNQFKVRLNSFVRITENLFTRRKQRRVCQFLQSWKEHVLTQRMHEQFQQNQM